MKEIRFIDEARIEFLAAVTYHEQIERGLGVRFRNVVEAASALAARLPNAGSQWKHGTRRVFTKNFPFSIVNRVKKDAIVILAVAHFRRRPEYRHSRRGDG